MGAVIYAEPKCGRRRREAFYVLACGRWAVAYSTMYCLYSIATSARATASCATRRLIGTTLT